MFVKADSNVAAALPTSAKTMNYNSVILTGVVALTGIWWVLHGWRNYPGPKLYLLHTEGVVLSE